MVFNMRNYGFRVITQISRPERTLVECFRDIPTANIADNMNRMSCIDPAIHSINGLPILGTAVTVKGPEGDNLMFHKALDLAKPGDVIVFSSVGQSNRSICGELMINYARELGLAGFVIDGYIRDIEGIMKSGFPVYARGTNPNGPYKNGPGEINVPVAVGNQVVFPGDILVGDADAVCVIRPEDAEGVCMLAARQKELEEQKYQGILAGKGLKRDWLDKALADKKCEIV